MSELSPLTAPTGWSEDGAGGRNSGGRAERGAGLRRDGGRYALVRHHDVRARAVSFTGGTAPVAIS